jgi:hypothetical protein
MRNSTANPVMPKDAFLYCTVEGQRSDENQEARSMREPLR